ncbi:MAG: hypothetical protein E7005_06205 [Alphaproteobacteria bacterium]|nr:hypothetical protein [Alphaproteobacteria bacterium]
MNRRDLNSLKENMIFVGTIYDSFEALEETLGKLKLERPLFITHVAKLAFAEEVFKRADEDFIDYKYVPNCNNKNTQEISKTFN